MPRPLMRRFGAGNGSGGKLESLYRGYRMNSRAIVRRGLDPDAAAEIDFGGRMVAGGGIEPPTSGL